MNFKTFTILFWGTALVIPFAWAIIGDWESFNDATPLWLYITGGIYAVACLAEHISNKKKK